MGLMEGYLIGYLPQNQYLPGLLLAAPVILLLRGLPETRGADVVSAEGQAAA